MTTALGTSAAGGPFPLSNEGASGERDFDWELGSWRTTVRVLVNPLSGAEEHWFAFSGTSDIHPLIGGRANVVELSVSGPAGRIDGLNLRLYEPQRHRWSMTFVNLKDGTPTPSLYGGFHDGVGEFHGDDDLGGRPIKVRFRVHRTLADQARFEQAYSQDGGQTWETNWVALDSRVDTPLI